MKRLFVALSLSISIFGLSHVASAHHSRSNFDDSKSVTFTGTVTEFAWTNPHIFIEVVDGDTTWLVESHSVTGMRRRGWTKDIFKVGETVTVTGTPDKDASKFFVAMSTITKSNGETLTQRGQREAREEIAPSTDFSGVWGMDMRNFDVRAAGGPPPSDWPYTDEGRRQAAAYDAEDSPELQCKHIGVPRIMIYPYSIEFTRTDKSLNILKEHLDERRTIWFDAADAAGEPPSPTGTSIATYVSETELHVRTDNFTPTEWGVENALDSSDQKVVEETFTLSDDGLRFDIAMTITDPVLFTQPLLRDVSFNKESDREIVNEPCDTRAADRHVTLTTTADAPAKIRSWWDLLPR